MKTLAQNFGLVPGGIHDAGRTGFAISAVEHDIHAFEQPLSYLIGVVAGQLLIARQRHGRTQQRFAHSRQQKLHDWMLDEANTDGAAFILLQTAGQVGGGG